MKDFVSRRAKEIKPSGIRKFFDIVSEQKDVISLGVGEPDFITPWVIRDAGINSIKKGRTQYTSNSGLLVLRNKISEYLEQNGYATVEAEIKMVPTMKKELSDEEVEKLENFIDKLEANDDVQNVWHNADI